MEWRDTTRCKAYGLHVANLCLIPGTALQPWSSKNFWA